VVIFIFSVIFSRETGLWVGAAVLLMFTVAWLGVPLLMRRAEREGSS
jgi:hypothetical protein